MDLKHSLLLQERKLIDKSLKMKYLEYLALIRMIQVIILAKTLRNKEVSNLYM
jgi:hypothetical protein